jgi:hypothetical protein
MLILRVLARDVILTNYSTEFAVRQSRRSVFSKCWNAETAEDVEATLYLAALFAAYVA